MYGGRYNHAGRIEKKEELLWQNGFAAYAVMYMKATLHLKSVHSAEFLQRNSTSRKAK